MNHLILVGILKETPVVKESASGIKYATMLVEVTRGFKNSDGEYDSDLVNCLLWRNVAENVIPLCESGTCVGIKGRLQSEIKVSSEGNTFYNYEVIAERVSILSK